MTAAASAALATAAVQPARRASLSCRLRDLFEELSGIEMAEVEGAAPFVEIGLDSLTLTQAAIQVKKHFKVNLTFRQLMESYRSFDALAEYLDATLPPEAAPATAVAAAVPVAAAQPVGAAAAADGRAGRPGRDAADARDGRADADAGRRRRQRLLVQQVIAQQMS